MSPFLEKRWLCMSGGRTSVPYGPPDVWLHQGPGHGYQVAETWGGDLNPGLLASEGPASFPPWLLIPVEMRGQEEGVPWPPDSAEETTLPSSRFLPDCGWKRKLPSPGQG